MLFRSLERGILVICAFLWTQLFLVYYFFQCEEMIIDYCVPRYNYAYILKTLCNWAMHWDPHLLPTNKNLDRKNKVELSLSSLINFSYKGGGEPSLTFLFIIRLSFSHSSISFSHFSKLRRGRPLLAEILERGERKSTTFLLWSKIKV